MCAILFSFDVIADGLFLLLLYNLTALSLPNVAKGKIRQKKSQILFCKFLKNKYHHVKVQIDRFHLNGHPTGFLHRLKS